MNTSLTTEIFVAVDQTFGPLKFMLVADLLIRAIQ